jgi:hypothetical protein
MDMHQGENSETGKRKRKEKKLEKEEKKSQTRGKKIQNWKKK